MSKKNGKANLYPDLMQPSSSDTVALAQAVRERVLQVAHLYHQSRGVHLTFPESMAEDVRRWKDVLVRHGAGDFRNSRSELLATRAVAQWSLNVKRALCGQPTEQLEWGE